MNLLYTLLTIGLPAIDESLDKLLVAMESFPNVAVLGDAVGLARVIGLCLALCVGSYECWMMMLGRRGMDVMKLLRIIGISLCISSSSWIWLLLNPPDDSGKALSKETIDETALNLWQTTRLPPEKAVLSAGSAQRYRSRPTRRRQTQVLRIFHL